MSDFQTVYLLNCYVYTEFILIDKIPFYRHYLSSIHNMSLSNAVKSNKWIFKCQYSIDSLIITSVTRKYDSLHLTPGTSYIDYNCQTCQ